MAIDDDLNEAEQVERLKAWWSENWAWLLSGVVLGLAIIIGWFWWTNRQESSSEQAGDLYNQLVAASDANNFGIMESLSVEIHRDYGRTPYADQADLLMARMYVETGEYDKAATALRTVMDDSRDDELRAIARLRLARVLVQDEKVDDALALLDPADAGAFAALTQDIRGDALFAKGDPAGARAAWEAALAATPALEPEERQLVEYKLQDLEGDAPATAGEPASAEATPAEATTP